MLPACFSARTCSHQCLAAVNSAAGLGHSPSRRLRENHGDQYQLLTANLQCVLVMINQSLQQLVGREKTMLHPLQETHPEHWLGEVASDSLTACHVPCTHIKDQQECYSNHMMCTHAFTCKTQHASTRDAPTGLGYYR